MGPSFPTPCCYPFPLLSWQRRVRPDQMFYINIARGKSKEKGSFWGNIFFQGVKTDALYQSKKIRFPKQCVWLGTVDHLPPSTQGRAQTGSEGGSTLPPSPPDLWEVMTIKWNQPFSRPLSLPEWSKEMSWSVVKVQNFFFPLFFLVLFC